MQTVGIVLNVAADRTAEFERGFREMELPTWQDFKARGVLTAATLSRLDISTESVGGAVQYLVVVIFPTDEGHHLHDEDPRFAAWNKRADAYQSAEPLVFGGDTIVSVGAWSGSAGRPAPAGRSRPRSAPRKPRRSGGPPAGESA